MLLIVLSLNGCKSYKEVTDTKKERLFIDTDKTLQRIDSIFENGAINDKFTIPIPQANTGDPVKDQELNIELLALVKRLSTQKSSGSNSYRVGVNDNNELFLKAFIAGTKSVKSVEKKHDSISTISEKEQQQTSVEKVYVYPWWLYAILIGGGLWISFDLISIVTPSIKMIIGRFKK